MVLPRPLRCFPGALASRLHRSSTVQQPTRPAGRAGQRRGRPARQQRECDHCCWPVGRGCTSFGGKCPCSGGIPSARFLLVIVNAPPGTAAPRMQLPIGSCPLSCRAFLADRSWACRSTRTAAQARSQRQHPQAVRAASAAGTLPSWGHPGATLCTLAGRTHPGHPHWSCQTPP